MPLPGRISESLFRASLYLLVIVIPFTVMAIPVITQEFARSPTSANPESSKLTHKEIFDIVFGILLLLFLFGTFAWVGGFPFPPLVAVDWLYITFRPIIDVLSALRLRALFRRAADAIVGTAGAQDAAQTLEGNTSTPAPTTSHRLPAENAEPEGSRIPPAHLCVSAASEDSHLASPSPA